MIEVIQDDKETVVRHLRLVGAMEVPLLHHRLVETRHHQHGNQIMRDRRRVLSLKANRRRNHQDRRLRRGNHLPRHGENLHLYAIGRVRAGVIIGDEGNLVRRRSN